ncbi:MAG: hypothetical protein HC782_02050 [Gammaproteobacteria bacterium]|nr:hypothetical protein [Gammaproteobacteria bacterium]
MRLLGMMLFLTLGTLKRTGLMPQSAADDIRLNAEIELIKSRPAQRDLLMDQWKKLETAIRYQPRLVEALATRLIALGLDNDAGVIIEETLAKYLNKHAEADWSSAHAALARCYADAKRTQRWRKLNKLKAGLNSIREMLLSWRRSANFVCVKRCGARRKAI